jgi:hypothetical protein
MPIEYQCKSCNCTLRVADCYAGRKSKCPRCGSITIAGQPTSPAAKLGARREAPKAAPKEAVRRPSSPVQGRLAQTRVGKPVRLPPLEEEEESLDALPSEPKEGKERVAPTMSAEPLRRPSPSVEPEGQVEQQEDLPRSKRRKRKRRRPQSVASSGPPTYLRWVIVGAVYGLIGLSIAGYMIANGQLADLLVYGIVWAVMMVVSSIILVASMFISSAIAGGIDFGDAFTAIPKSLFLLAPINLLYLLPLAGIGFIRFFLVLPIWTIGLMTLFRLDLWEARFLIFINWLLNQGAFFVLFMMFTAMMQAGKLDLERDLPRLQDEKIAEEEPLTAEEIVGMGGTVERNSNVPDQPVIAISFHGTPLDDEQLARLYGFRELVRLDLSETQITDRGLATLPMVFPKLQVLTISGTRTTDPIVNALRQAMPGVNIVR